MRARHKVSRAGVELIKSFEGLRQKATRLVDGRWSIGYGHTYSAREGASVTTEDAEALLRFDLLPVVDGLNNLVHTPLNQNQFDALVSFAFNIGIENFITADVLRRINEGRLAEAAQAMDNWTSADYNGQTYVLAPLVRRRAAEKALFLTPDEGGVEIDADMIAPGAIRPSTPAPTAPIVAPASKPVIVRVADIAESAPLPDSYALRRQADQEAAIQAELIRLEAQKIEIQRQVEERQREDERRHLEAQRLEQLRLAEEKRLREDMIRREESLRQEAMLQAQALAAARIAEEARIEVLRRQEAERIERERAEQARLERERLETEARVRIAQETREREQREAEALRTEALRAETLRLEQAEQARLAREQAETAAREAAEAAAKEAEAKEAEAREAEAKEAEAKEAEKRELARLETERLEAERVEAERIAAETLAHEQAEAEQARLAEVARQEEEARKAEAAAALMRLYSPYASMGGTLVKLHTDGDKSAPEPAVTVPVMTPPAATVASAFELSAQPLVEESLSEEVTPREEGMVQEVRAEAAVEASTPAPEAVRPHWREQLQRPLPGQPLPSAPEVSAPVASVSEAMEVPVPERTSLTTDYVPSLSEMPDPVFDDDDWTTEDGRVALSADEEAEDGNSVWKMFTSTLMWIVSSVVGLAALGGATASYYQSQSDVNIGQGQSEQFTVISSVLAVIGIICVCVSVYLILKRLGGLKD